jgi:hypothetical protein
MALGGCHASYPSLSLAAPCRRSLALALAPAFAPVCAPVEWHRPSAAPAARLSACPHSIRFLTVRQA